MQPRLIVNPYSFEKSLFKAYDSIFEMVGENDWICFKDGDACFIETSDFGHLLGYYIEKYPSTGLFTCMATKCSYSFQRPEEIELYNWDVKQWAFISRAYFNKYHNTENEVEAFTRRFAGHLVMIKKGTWNKIRSRLLHRITIKGKMILGFDTQLAHTMTDLRLKKLLIKGIVLGHVFRPLTGENDKIE